MEKLIILPLCIQGWEVSRYSLGRAWIEAILWLGLSLDLEFLGVECTKDTLCLVTTLWMNRRASRLSRCRCRPPKNMYREQPCLYVFYFLPSEIYSEYNVPINSDTNRLSGSFVMLSWAACRCNLGLRMRRCCNTCMQL